MADKQNNRLYPKMVILHEVRSPFWEDNTTHNGEKQQKDPSTKILNAVNEGTEMLMSRFMSDLQINGLNILRCNRTLIQ